MKMNNYSITSIFRKIDNNWKIIHAHESALPPEIIKNG
jgi:ketosteroid isomerase-like protein